MFQIKIAQQSKQDKSESSQAPLQDEKLQLISILPKSKLIYKNQNDNNKKQFKCSKQILKRQQKFHKYQTHIKYSNNQSKRQAIAIKKKRQRTPIFMVEIKSQNNFRLAVCMICRDKIKDINWKTHCCTQKYYTNTPYEESKLIQGQVVESNQQYWVLKQCFACKQNLLQNINSFPSIKHCCYCLSAIHNSQFCIKKSNQQCNCFHKPLKLTNMINPPPFKTLKTKQNTKYLGLKNYKIKDKDKKEEYKKQLNKIQKQLKSRGKISTKNVFWEGYDPNYQINKSIPYLSKQDSLIVQEYLQQLTKVPIKMIPMQNQKDGFDIVVLQDIQKDVYICQYSGDVIPIKYAKLCHFYVMGYLDGLYSKNQYIIAPVIHWSLGNLFNHNNQPNIASSRAIVNHQPVVLIYTIKNIKAGTPLRYNYNGNQDTTQFYDVNFTK